MLIKHAASLKKLFIIRLFNSQIDTVAFYRDGGRHVCCLTLLSDGLISQSNCSSGIPDEINSAYGGGARPESPEKEKVVFLRWRFRAGARLKYTDIYH